jgi:hypothetical protein
MSGLLSRSDLIATPVCTNAYVASYVVSAKPCVVRMMSAQIDPTLADDDLYVLVFDAASLQSDGAVVALKRFAHVKHVQDTAEIVNFDGMIRFDTGCVVALSTTGPDTLTIASADMVVMADVLP